MFAGAVASVVVELVVVVVVVVGRVEPENGPVPSAVEEKGNSVEEPNEIEDGELPLKRSSRSLAVVLLPLRVVVDVVAGVVDEEVGRPEVPPNRSFGEKKRSSFGSRLTVGLCKESEGSLANWGGGAALFCGCCGEFQFGAADSNWF